MSQDLFTFFENSLKDLIKSDDDYNQFDNCKFYTPEISFEEIKWMYSFNIDSLFYKNLDKQTGYVFSLLKSAMAQIINSAIKISAVDKRECITLSDDIDKSIPILKKHISHYVYEKLDLII